MDKCSVPVRTVPQSTMFHLQSVAPDREADGAWRPVPVVGVSEGKAESQARRRQAQAVLLDVRQRGQRLGDVLLLRGWRRVQDGTQTLRRHRLHLSRQPGLHLDEVCCVKLD